MNPLIESVHSTIHRRQWPILLSVLTVAAGLAYAFWWPSLVRHQPYYWALPGDIWSSFRVAHMIAWGSISYSYSAHAGLVTLPGYEVLLAPFAALSGRLGLVESSPAVFLDKPTAWILIGPFVLAAGSIPLVALDKVGERLEVHRVRRILLVLGGAIVLWPVAAIWGHPEDVLALGFGILSLLAAFDGKLARAGWLLGLALCMQLVVVLLVPVVVAVVGRRRVVPLLLRASVLPGSLAVAVLVPDFHDAWHALTSQPNYPTVNHSTPWVSLSPRIAPHVVAAGPGRLLGFVVAVGCGIVAVRRRHDFRWIVWLGAVAMAGRCIFEAVVDPYYLAPAVVLAAAVAYTNGRLYSLGAIMTGGFATVMTYWHANMWAWWLEMTVPLLLMLWAAHPSNRSARYSPLGDTSDEVGHGMTLPVAASQELAMTFDRT